MSRPPSNSAPDQAVGTSLPTRSARAGGRGRRLLIAFVVTLALLTLAVALVLLDLVVPSYGDGSSGAPTLPACNAGFIAEGFSYYFRDPHRGELVNFRVRGKIGAPITPDPDGATFIAKRVIGIPGDTVSWRHNRVLVNGRRADDIATPRFTPLRLRTNEYFLLGDNRSYSQDSRDFGPVPRQAIFSRVILIWSPLNRLGTPGYDKTLKPPGRQTCS